MAAAAPAATPAAEEKHSIVMASDFFFPRVGGVEQHIWSLSQCLLAAGHRVCVVTGRYAAPASGGGGCCARGGGGGGGGGSAPRVGVRYMAGGLRVYHLPHAPMADQASLPTYFALLPLLRAIFLRERATVAHGHAATSVFTHDFILAARSLGLPAVFTDHSLFGSRDFAAINVNKYLTFALRDVQAVITVSRAAADNVCARAAVARELVHTIPNAIDAAKFAPPAAPPPPPRARARAGAPPAPVTIVLVSRLVPRKGVALAAAVIERACARWPHVRFVVGGDGPERPRLAAAAARVGGGRVELLGAVPHARVRDVLARGAIFLNTSLTESFCIAVLEAAAAGCHVVATAVGGVPEVLPAHMMTLAAPDADDVLRALGEALARAPRAGGAAAQHAEVAALYSWPAVAARTAAVYAAVRAAPRAPLAARLARLACGGGAGALFGPLTAVLAALVQLMALALDVLAPADDMDAAPRAPGDEEVWAARALLEARE